MDASNVSDFEEANNHESGTDVLHVECEEESNDASHSGFRTDNKSEISTFQ